MTKEAKENLTALAEKLVYTALNALVFWPFSPYSYWKTFLATIALYNAVVVVSKGVSKGWSGE